MSTLKTNKTKENENFDFRLKKQMKQKLSFRKNKTQ